MGTAVSVGYDETTKGSWIGVYGSDGYAIPLNATSNPSYCTPSITGTSYNWGINADVRALQLAATPATRQNSTWYDGTAVVIDCNITSGTRRIGLYLYDGDNTGRASKIEVIDIGTSTVLDSRSCVGYFTVPKWFFWDCTGNIRFRISLTASSNAVLAGIFFQPTTTSGAITPYPVPVMGKIANTRITNTGVGAFHQLVKGPSFGGGGSTDGSNSNYGYIA